MMPETGSMVATAVLLLVQLPPEMVSNMVSAIPKQKADVPDTMPASAGALTVMGNIAVAVPQLLVSAYIMVSLPAATPVTIPPETVASDVLVLDHTVVPVTAVSPRVMVEPAQTNDEPVMAPAFGNGFTVKIAATPQPEESV